MPRPYAIGALAELEELPCPMELLEWDSHHFGFPVARVDASGMSDAMLATILEGGYTAGVRLVYCFAPTSCAMSDTILRRFGGSLIARQATFTASIDDLLCKRATNPDMTIDIGEYPRGCATDTLRALGLLAGKFSRFHSDPRIPAERFESLYEQWVENSTQRRIADSVFVARTHSGELVGLVTARLADDTGAIGLLAVAEAARGRKVAQRLLHTIHEWMAGKEILAASVVTQLENEPACKLYQRVGYELACVKHAYHFWLS